MATTKSKPVKKAVKAAAAKNGASSSTALDVLTLAEAAAYLRVAETDVLHLVQSQGLAGRQIGAEWRFLKSNLRDWLSTPATKTGNEALLALARPTND